MERFLFALRRLSSECILRAHGYERSSCSCICSGGANFAPGAASSSAVAQFFGLCVEIFGLFFGLPAQIFRMQQRHFCPFCFDWIVTRRTLHLALTSVESDPKNIASKMRCQAEVADEMMKCAATKRRLFDKMRSQK